MANKYTVKYFGVEYVFETDKPTYILGESITVTLTYRNAGKSPVTRIFESGFRLRITVFDNMNQPIYWNSAGSAKAIAEVLQPQVQSKYQQVWHQQDQAGNPVGPGTYEIVGETLHMGGPTLQVRVEIH